MVGQTVSHYRILEQLGGGGMGIVYKATDVRLNRFVAIKFLAPALTRDPEANQRFRQEAQAASALDHVNICTIHEIDETADRALFMVMAYYPGETLKHLIQRGPLPIQEALDIAIQIAKALARAHDSGLVHRDIKPANLMVTAEGVVKILDFGLVKLTGESDVTRTGTTLGTVAYMSPEQIRGADVDARTDLWSLGVVLFEMLTGRRPFTGKDDLALVSSVLGDPPPAIETLRRDVPPDVRRVVERALQKSPAARYQTATELLTDLTACRAALTDSPANATLVGVLRRRPLIAVGAVIVALAIAIPALFVYRRSAREQNVRRQVIPEVVRLIQADDYGAAFALARKAEADLPANDPALAELWPQISAIASFTTTPSGADVYLQEYAATTDEWQHLGQTPIEHIRLPLGTFRFRVEKKGFAPRVLASTNPGAMLHNFALGPPGSPPPPFEITLEQEGSAPGMVRVPGGTFPVSLSGFNLETLVPLDAFLIDQYEVTNQAYKTFVDSGAYADEKDWIDLPRHEGSPVWPGIVSQFHDSSGRPGPSTWELGQFPSGQGEFPVGGVSWFEAAAYCRSRGKSLPTVYHWARAALSPIEIFSPVAPAIIPASNFGRKGPARGGEFRGVGPYGTYDMGGNVREWVWNEAAQGRRWNLGGAWNDQPWMFVVPNSTPPLDRSSTNGFRCAKFVAPQVEAIAGLVETRKLGPSKPVSNEVFEVFKRQLDYPKTPVDLRLESTDTASSEWIVQRVSVGAARDDNNRIPADLFLPRNAKPPFQLLVYFPGIGPFFGRGSSAARQLGFLDFIPKSGRAVLYPVWKGSYERWDPFLTLTGDEYLRTFRTRMADWRQDLGRLLDGLEQRQDMDSARIGYMGVSFGSSTAVPLLALEDRLKVAVLLAPGYPYRDLPPEANAINFAPRITIPVLMIGGRHDYVLPLETSQKPMFEALGTPADRKRHVVFDTGHMDFPRSETIREVLPWLDRYLGPVETR